MFSTGQKLAFDPSVCGLVIKREPPIFNDLATGVPLAISGNCCFQNSQQR